MKAINTKVKIQSQFLFLLLAFISIENANATKESDGYWNDFPRPQAKQCVELFQSTSQSSVSQVPSVRSEPTLKSREVIVVEKVRKPQIDKEELFKRAEEKAQESFDVLSVYVTDAFENTQGISGYINSRVFENINAISQFINESTILSNSNLQKFNNLVKRMHELHKILIPQGFLNKMTLALSFRNSNDPTKKLEALLEYMKLEEEAKLILSEMNDNLKTQSEEIIKAKEYSIDLFIEKEHLERLMQKMSRISDASKREVGLITQMLSRKLSDVQVQIMILQQFGITKETQTATLLDLQNQLSSLAQMVIPQIKIQDLELYQRAIQELSRKKESEGALVEVASQKTNQTFLSQLVKELASGKINFEDSFLEIFKAALKQNKNTMSVSDVFFLLEKIRYANKKFTKSFPKKIRSKDPLHELILQLSKETGIRFPSRMFEGWLYFYDSNVKVFDFTYGSIKYIFVTALLNSLDKIALLNNLDKTAALEVSASKKIFDQVYAILGLERGDVLIKDFLLVNISRERGLSRDLESNKTSGMGAEIEVGLESSDIRAIYNNPTQELVDILENKHEFFRKNEEYFIHGSTEKIIEYLRKTPMGSLKIDDAIMILDHIEQEYLGLSDLFTKLKDPEFHSYGNIIKLNVTDDVYYANRQILLYSFMIMDLSKINKELKSFLLDRVRALSEKDSEFSDLEKALPNLLSDSTLKKLSELKKSKEQESLKKINKTIVKAYYDHKKVRPELRYAMQLSLKSDPTRQDLRPLFEYITSIRAISLSELIYILIRMPRENNSQISGNENDVLPAIIHLYNGKGTANAKYAIGEKSKFLNLQISILALAMLDTKPDSVNLIKAIKQNILDVANRVDGVMLDESKQNYFLEFIDVIIKNPKGTELSGPPPFPPSITTGAWSDRNTEETKHMYYNTILELLNENEKIFNTKNEKNYFHGGIKKPKR